MHFKLSTIKLFLYYLLFIITSSSVTANTAKQNKEKSWYIFSFENDAFGIVDTNDDGYSNGVGFAWGYAPFNSFESIDMPGWIRFITKNTYINQGNNNNYSIVMPFHKACIHQMICTVLN